MPPQFETSRLILRPWRDDDVHAWIALNADPVVMEFFPSALSREEAEASAKRLRERLDVNGYGWWVAEVRDGTPFAGVVALQDVPSDLPFAPALEVGWRFAQRFWGYGFATEGATALLDFAFAALGRVEVVSMTARLNVRSQRVMQRLGMTRDMSGDFDHPRLHEGHRLRPHVLYRIGAPIRSDASVARA
jgi:RimJ/RimL family protein N-acetyltransferase